MIDRKGIFSFLIITFGITYLLEGILILSGVRIGLTPAPIMQFTVMVAMWMHGVFYSQAYGIWRMLLFANTNPILGGITGLVGICILLLVGFATLQWAKRRGPAVLPVMATAGVLK